LEGHFDYSLDVLDGFLNSCKDRTAYSVHNYNLLYDFTSFTLMEMTMTIIQFEWYGYNNHHNNPYRRSPVAQHHRENRQEEIQSRAVTKRVSQKKTDFNIELKEYENYARRQRNDTQKQPNIAKVLICHR
jgi:hypothetical protein